MRLKRYFGPSTLVTAAFIGPGSITLCSIAGVQSGYSLLWALILSGLTTIVLQEMAARLGYQTAKGIPEALHEISLNKFFKYTLFLFIFSAIIIGNAAYEAGNISGAALGLELLFDNSRYWALAVGVFSAIILHIGKYKWIENMLIALVLVMSTCFLITAIIVFPDFKELLRGLFPGRINSEELLLVSGLIGTTVVPYNLFLHASIISKKWDKTKDIRDLRIESIVSITLGIIISALIVIVAAASRESISNISNAGDLAVQLEPLVGSYASLLMGIGLFAAGFSSALTAALAAAYVAKGIFKLKGDEENPGFKLVWMSIIIIACVVTLLNIDLIAIIRFAQLTNAVILPSIAIFLLYLCNKTSIMGELRNKLYQNIIATIFIIISIGIALRTLIILF